MRLMVVSYKIKRQPGRNGGEPGTVEPGHVFFRKAVKFKMCNVPSCVLPAEILQKDSLVQPIGT